MSKLKGIKVGDLVKYNPEKYSSGIFKYYICGIILSIKYEMAETLLFVSDPAAFEERNLRHSGFLGVDDFYEWADSKYNRNIPLHLLVKLQ